jgi:hypothetical protein
MKDLNKITLENKKFAIYFTNVIQPDSEGTVGWISAGKDEKEAFENLKTHLLKKGYPENYFQVLKLKAVPVSDDSLKVYRRLQ